MVLGKVVGHSMRILHLYDHSAPLQSGYVFRSLGLLSAQRAMGWETIHVTSPKHGQFCKSSGDRAQETIDGWTFHRTPPVRGASLGVPGVDEITLMNATTRRLAELVEEFKPDLVHAHSPVLNAVPAARVSRRFRIPVVYELRAFWEDAAEDLGRRSILNWRNRATRKLETLMMRRVNAVFTLCEGMRMEIVARGIPAEKVTVIPNAVDNSRFHAAKERDGALASALGLSDAMVLGFIGSFYHYEGLAFLIQALPRVLERVPRVKVLLVGGGPEDKALRRLTADLGLSDRVVFTGRVPNVQVESYYGLVDILVYPRLPMRLTDLVTPLKPLEAMAQSRLVLASDVGGHRELIEDGVTGYLFKSGDADSLACRVQEITEAGTACEAVLARGRAFVENERNWLSSAARYRPVYERLVGRQL